MPCDGRARKAAEQMEIAALEDEIAAAIIAGDISIQKNLKGEVYLTSKSIAGLDLVRQSRMLGLCDGCVLRTIARRLPEREAAPVQKQFILAGHTGHKH